MIWDIGLNTLIVSILFPKKSILCGYSSPKGQTSIMPPLTAYSLGSNTTPTFSYPSALSLELTNSKLRF